MAIYRTSTRTSSTTKTKSTKLIFVHIFLVVAATIYALAGGYIFHIIEGTNEVNNDPIRNRTITLLANQLHQWNHKPVKSPALFSVSPLDENLTSFLEQFEHGIRNDDIQLSDIIRELLNLDAVPSDRKWDIPSSILFAFTVITTIGYGNIAPTTFNGRLFCIFYGLIGIPLAMMAIADMGKFTCDFAFGLWVRLRRGCVSILKRKRTSAILSDKVTNTPDDSAPADNTESAAFIAILFLTYVFLGAAFLPMWEDLKFFDSIYFSFVTLTTIGFGDIVPRKYIYLIPTLLYIVIGLALTTMTIESAGIYFRKLHYLGKKLKNTKHVLIWFGGRSITADDFVRALGKEMGVDPSKINEVANRLDELVDNHGNDITDQQGNLCDGKYIGSQETEETLYNISSYLMTKDSLPYVDDDDVSTYKSNSTLSSSNHKIPSSKL